MLVKMKVKEHLGVRLEKTKDAASHAWVSCASKMQHFPTWINSTSSRPAEFENIHFLELM